MKLSLTGVARKRPFPTSFWNIIWVVSFFTIFVGVNMLLWQSQIGQMALLLAKVVIYLIPPFIWLGGGILVTLWLILLRWLWQPQSV